MNRFQWIGFLCAGCLMVGLPEPTRIGAGQVPSPPIEPSRLNPAAMPPDSPGTGKGWEQLPTPAAASEQVRRLQAERDALKAARGNTDQERPTDEAGADRAKVKARLLELIDQLREKSTAALASRPRPEVRGSDSERSHPVDSVRQIQNLYRAGEIQAALRAVTLVDTGNLSRQQFLLLRYLEASCHRKLGAYPQAKTIYKEVAESKDDPFIADCAAWQLIALQTRSELAGRIGSTGTPGKEP